MLLFHFIYSEYKTIDDLLEDAIDTISILNAKIVERKTFELKHDAGTRNIIVIKKLIETDLKIILLLY